MGFTFFGGKIWEKLMDFTISMMKSETNSLNEDGPFVDRR